MEASNNEEAAELAARAAQQGKNAGKNAGRAVKAVAEPVLEDIQDNVEKLEGTVEDAVDAAKRFDLRMLSRITSDTGVGFLAMSISISAALVAYTKFRGVISRTPRA